MYPSSYLYLGYRMRFSEDILAVLQKLDTYVNSEQEHIGITNVVLRLRQIFPTRLLLLATAPAQALRLPLIFLTFPFPHRRITGTAKNMFWGGYYEPVNRRR